MMTGNRIAILWAFAALVLASLGLTASPARADLLAYYPFNKDFTDSSGNHRDLVVANGTPTITTAAGEYVFGGGALDVDSTISTAEFLNLPQPIVF